MKVLNSNLTGVRESGGEDPADTEAFKLVHIDGIIRISDFYENIGRIVRVSAEAKVERTDIISTAKSKAFDGQTLTGQKLVLDGIITIKLQYVPVDGGGAIRSAEFQEPFSDFIVLRPDIEEDEQISVECKIENIHIRKISKRKLFKSITLLLRACEKHRMGSIRHDNTKGRVCSEAENDLKLSARTQRTVCESMEPRDKSPDIREIVSFQLEPEILSVCDFDTHRGFSIEGRYFTGKICLLELKLKYKLLYSSDDSSQSLYGIEGEFYKSIYIVVPPHINGCSFEQLLKHKLLKVNVYTRQSMAWSQHNRDFSCAFVIDAEVELIPTHEICCTYKEEGRSGLSIMFGDGRNNTLLLLEKGCDMIKPQWSPMGLEICCKHRYKNRDVLGITDIKTLRTKDIAVFEEDEKLGGCCWADKGRKLVFSVSSSRGRELFLADLMTVKIVRLTDGKKVISSYKPKASPDGDYVAFIKSTGQLKNLWLMDISSFRQLRLTEEGFVRDFAWSGNGKHIVYVTSRPLEKDKLYLVDTTAQKSRLLFDKDYFERINGISVSPDGRRIAFTGISGKAEDIYVMGLDGGGLKCITDNIPGVSLKNIVWGRDSSKVYYTGNPSGYYNIYWCSIDSKDRGQVTDTTSSRIEFSFKTAMYL